MINANERKRRKEEKEKKYSPLNAQAQLTVRSVCLIRHSPRFIVSWQVATTNQCKRCASYVVDMTNKSLAATDLACFKTWKKNSTCINHPTDSRRSRLASSSEQLSRFYLSSRTESNIYRWESLDFLLTATEWIKFWEFPSEYFGWVLVHF